MKHWNFFPSLFLLLAVFWLGHIDLTKTQLEIEQFRPKIEIKSPLLDGPMNFGVPQIPPLYLPPENTPFFDPHAPNSAENPKSQGLPNSFRQS
jgi:hypothetical protein